MYICSDCGRRAVVRVQKYEWNTHKPVDSELNLCRDCLARRVQQGLDKYEDTAILDERLKMQYMQDLHGETGHWLVSLARFAQRFLPSDDPSDDSWTRR